MISETLGAFYDFAVARLHDAGGDFEALAIPVRTLLLVESAQGIIDNGGLEYFYEADFPGNPPYSVFVEAYRRIGAEDAAACIEQSAALFPFDQPELFEPLRLVWLEKMRAGSPNELKPLGDRIAADASVWRKLEDYVRAHRGAFTGRGEWT